MTGAQQVAEFFRSCGTEFTPDQAEEALDLIVRIGKLAAQPVQLVFDGAVVTVDSSATQLVFNRLEG